MNFLQDNQAILDCPNKTLSLHNGLAIAPLISNFDRESILSLTKTLTIPARSECLVAVNVNHKFLNKTLIVERWGSLKNRMISVATALIKPTFNKTVCRLVNAGNIPRTLQKNTPIATVEFLQIDDNTNTHLLGNSTISHPQQCMPIIDAELPSHEIRVQNLKAMGIDFDGTVLKNDDLHQLSALLYRNIDLFAKSDLDLPGSNLPPHKFEMDTDRVIQSKQFFLPPGQISELKRQTQNLLDAKIIERSSSL
jgi:hypothetical protein